MSLFACIDVPLDPSPWIQGLSLKQAARELEVWCVKEEMEGNQRLLQVIHEMQSEIIQLEQENQALRREMEFSERNKAKQEEGAGERNQKEKPGCLSSSGEGTTGCPGALCKSVSAGSALTLQKQKGNVMTVRRYSTLSMPSFSSKKLHKRDKRNPFKGTLDIKGIIKPSPFATDGQLSNKKDKELAKNQSDCLSNNAPDKKRDFQDQVYKCREKVKAVSFLLPMDM